MSRLDGSQSRTLSALWRAIFLVSFPFGILGFLLPVYGRELGATALEVGVFFSAFAIVPIFVRPLLGRALDRWGRRPFLLIGLAGYLAAALAFGSATTVATLTAARFVQGLGSAFLWLTAYTMVADLAATSGRGLSFGLIDEATNRGAIIGTTIGFTLVVLLQQGGQVAWRQVWLGLFVVYALTTAGALVVAGRGAGETRPPDSERPPASRSISRSLITLMGIVFLTGASSAMVWPLLVIFLQDSLHAAVDGLALAYLPAALISSFLPSRMGVVSDRLGRKKPMMLGLLVGAAASALIPQLRSLIGLAALWAIEVGRVRCIRPGRTRLRGRHRRGRRARHELRSVHVRPVPRRGPRPARRRLALRQGRPGGALLSEYSLSGDRSPAGRRGPAGARSRRTARAGGGVAGLTASRLSSSARR